MKYLTEFGKMNLQDQCREMHAALHFALQRCELLEAKVTELEQLQKKDSEKNVFALVASRDTDSTR